MWRGGLYYRRTRVVLCRVNKRCTCLLQVFLLVERLILLLASTNPSYPGVHWYINLAVGSSSSTKHRRYQHIIVINRFFVASLCAQVRSRLVRATEQLVQRYAQTEWVSIKAMPGPEGPYALSNAAMELRKRGLGVCVCSAAAARPTLALVPGFFHVS